MQSSIPSKKKSRPNPAAAAAPAGSPGSPANTARVLTSGTSGAALVARYFPTLNDNVGVQAIADQISKDAKAVADGDMSNLEHLLLGQAVALHAMFLDLASRAKGQDQLQRQLMQTTLALKCAAQSRQAVTALAELRMPKMAVFARQANVTTGPQLVNNGVADDQPARAPRARGKIPPSGQTELLERSDGQWMDTRAKGDTGQADSHMEAVESVNRTKNR